VQINRLKTTLGFYQIWTVYLALHTCAQTHRQKHTHTHTHTQTHTLTYICAESPFAFKTLL